MADRITKNALTSSTTPTAPVSISARVVRSSASALRARRVWPTVTNIRPE